ncbi:22710_t:CDS:2 [Dentiscutata erythropus]|uniref:22710_t:CDS:1 n=1 Tax=Dentiscutata erythropus TaxID=1348616 RepID=A0A9N9G3L8_9GLOM|nr:22710_t:CDS:2 [Dentiscutata erythropus]
MDEFVNWLIENGATFPKVKFDKDEDGMGGCYAVQPIHPDEIIASLPLKLTISYKLAREHLPMLDLLGCRAVLATFLAHERLLGKSSFYYSYINILPTYIPTPLMYTEQEMSWLRGTNLGYGVESRKELLKKEFDEVLKVVSNGEFINVNGLTWELYLWACNIISSRCFPNKLIDPDDVEVKEALFPLIDSFNHKPRQKITWEIHEKNELRLVAGNYIEAGQQIYNNYGAKSNEELLVGYGFCIPNNPDDWVIIKANISQDPQCDEKLDLLTSLELSELTHFIKRDHIPSALLSQLRVLVMNSAELIHFKKLPESVDNNITEPIGYRNELAMLETFSNLLKMKLEVLLEREEFVGIGSARESETARNCKIYIDGQKEILTNALAIIYSKELIILKTALNDSKLSRIPKLPFVCNKININNDYNNSDTSFNDINSIILAKDDLLDSLLITTDKVMKIDKKFSRAINEIFSKELIDSEQDTILILYLIYESQYIEKSEWKLFFEVAVKYDDSYIQQYEEKFQELTDLYNELQPLVCNPDVKLFDKDVFSIDKLIWSTCIFEICSISFTNKNEKQCFGIAPL